MELYNLWTSGKREEAEKLQVKLSVMEWGFGKGGINGTKWVVAKYLGYPELSSACRRPYPLFTDKSKQTWITSQVKCIEAIEKSLKTKA